MEGQVDDADKEDTKDAWGTIKLSTSLPCGSQLQESFNSVGTTPTAEFLDTADAEAMRKLGISILDQPCSWDHSFAPAPSGELVRERSGCVKGASLFNGTRGLQGLKGLSFSAAALDAMKELRGTGASGGIVHTLSGENAVRGEKITWMRGENVGSGSMGAVFKGLDQKSGQLIAVKEVTIDEGQSDDLRLLKALENELSILQDLRHPQIVSFLGYDYIGNRLYVYLDYMPGGSLAQVLRDFGAFEECLTATYTHDIVKGLAYLHSREPPVLHRDIKGANILVDLDCRVKLADFGCSKRTEDQASASIRGSIPWMAPEVVMQQPSGRPADVWSLGCVVVEMTTGKTPWGDFDNHMAAMYRIGISKENVPIPSCLSSLGQDFVGVCVDRNPDKRATAKDLLVHGFVGALMESLLD